MKIRARSLDPSEFAPFGQVLGAGGASETRQEFAGRLANGRAAALANLAFIRNPPNVSPLRVPALERHPHSSQLFVPMRGTRYLVVVCPPTADGAADLPRIAAFIAGDGQAINYDVNVWHAPNRALAGPGEFVMLRWDDGTADDTEWCQLATPLEIVLE